MTFEPVYLKGHLVLFYEGRIGKISDQIPEELYTYEIRHSDEGFEPCELARSILVNHFGSIISSDEMLEEDELYTFIDEDEFEYCLEPAMTIDEYLYRQNQLSHVPVK